MQPEALFQLPPPRLDSPVCVEHTLQTRRSVRSYRNEALTLEHAGQLLWAAQGTTSARGLRTTPSAGALYPMELYLIAGQVTGLAAGVYHYRCRDHALSQTLSGDRRALLCQAALNQGCVQQAPAVFVLSAVYERITRRYGERGIRYVFMEAGHAAQNLCLQAVALDIGTVVIGAFRDDEVRQALQLPDPEVPLYLIPAGK
jgi:SagB-type dehydrogenase family enzyme